MSEKITVRTPLIYSKPLSDIAQRNVYLKLENTQPSGSFKLRGISHLCKEKYAEGCTKFVGASGGNAGLALAFSAEKLGIPCQIYVPKFVQARMLRKLRACGAEVIIAGNDIAEASQRAIDESKKDPSYAFIHPYDNPAIWEGHAAIFEEIKEDLRGRRPACIALSVGGGGMLMGIMLGMERAGWKEVPILALETVGADCFNMSLSEGRIVEVHPTSIAKTLGCRTPAAKLMEKCKEFHIISKVLEDKDAAFGSIRLADDHAMLVEPSCGVTVASVYSKVLPSILERHGYDSKVGPIVLLICGGSDVTLEMLQNFEDKFGHV